MTKEEFQSLLEYSTTLAYDFAKHYITNNLPTKYKYNVELNISTDNPSLAQFDIYPNDNNKKVKSISVSEVIELLNRNQKVPVWIDISVQNVENGYTIFNLKCAGRYSMDFNEYYYRKNNSGPFGIKSPNLPIGYNEGEKFKLPEKNSIFNWFR